MAVVEPLLPLADAEAIRDEIELARAAAESEAEPDDDDPDAAAEEWETRHVTPGPVPTEAEVREGFARIAARLAR
jgi:hypothetical protein